MPPGSGEIVDHFPSTHATWIVSQLASLSSTDTADAAQAAQELRTHIMARYREPLLAYATASSFRFLGTPEDLVHGFFADRLANLEFLRTWSGTGVRLRRWLCNGLLLHIFDIAKRRRRDVRALGAAVEARMNAPIESAELAAAEAFERTWARGVLERAILAVEASMSAEGRMEAWTLFRTHAIEGVSYPRLAAARGMGEGQVRAAVRLAARRFRDAIAAEMIRDGIPPADVEREAEAIVRAFGAI